MNYDQAKELMIAHAPSLIIDAEERGQNHVNVRKSVDGPHFSITLPKAPLPPAIEERAAVTAQPEERDDEGNVTKPAVPGSPHIDAKTPEVQQAETERTAFCDALDYALMSLPNPEADVPPGSERGE